MSEPAIQVRRKGKGTQVWTIEKLENKLVDMRDHYGDWREGTEELVRNRRNTRMAFRERITFEVENMSWNIKVFLSLFSFSITRQTVNTVTHSMRHKRTTT